MKLRFSIRDLLWLTLVVALCVGWWLDHTRHVPPRLSVIDFGRSDEALLQDKEAGYFSIWKVEWMMPVSPAQAAEWQRKDREKKP